MEMGVLNDGGQKEMLSSTASRTSPTDYDQGTFPVDGGPGACDWARNPGRWDTGTMLAYTGSELFTYACGDATKSYSDAQDEEFVRQFLFVQPDVVVVFDRVVVDEAGVQEDVASPHRRGAAHQRGRTRSRSNMAAGRLVCVPVLPEKRAI